MAPTHESAGTSDVVELLGMRFSPVTEQQATDTVLDKIAGGTGGQIYAANLDVLRLCHEDPGMREAVTAEADMLVADGTPLIWASRLRGTALPERVAGSTLLFTMSEGAARRGSRVFLLGGNEGVADGAADRLRAQYPALQVAGTYFPPFGFLDDPREVAAMERALVDAEPDLIFVGLPWEKQVELMPRLHALLPRAWVLGVGISFSFATGEVRRAPLWVQRIGLEWLHRLAQEPERLARRYLVHGPPTLGRLMLEALRTRLRSGR